MCIEGECLCTNGFYGKACEKSIAPKEGTGARVRKNVKEPEVTEHVSSKDKSNGINYLSHAEEAQNKKSQKQNMYLEEEEPKHARKPHHKPEEPTTIRKYGNPTPGKSNLS